MAKYKPSKISREKKSDVKKRFGNIFFFFLIIVLSLK